MYFSMTYIKLTFGRVAIFSMEVSGEEIHTEVCIIKTRLGKMYERAGVHKFSKTLAATSYFEAQAGSYEANSVLRTHKY